MPELLSFAKFKAASALGLKHINIVCKVGIVRIYLKKYKKTFKIGMRILIIRGIFLPHPA
jgi:hypothetical protein